MKYPLALATALVAGGAGAAQGIPSLANCAALAEDSARLACYDSLAGRGASAEPAQGKVSSAQPPPATIAPASVAGANAEDGFISPRLYQEKKNVNNRFVIIPHERNYLLPLTYNSNPNEEAWEQMHPGNGMDRVEAKFQISFKAIVWQDIAGSDMNLWGAYTQENWWQLYNTDASSPFRETDYQPELILSIPNNWHFLGVHNTRLDFSLTHQSNGASEPESRSWNRAIGSALFEHRNFSLVASAWYRIPEKRKEDDNPDIDDYMGNGQLQGVWKWPEYSLGFTFRNNLSSDNKGAIQLDWTFPISQRFSGYVQYFNGYGESLIDYNESSNRIGIGVSLTDPF
jgi:phospholipase A1